MPQIVQQGSINTTALVVPDLYVQIVQPAALVINGVPTDTTGVVGTATWGPVNTPVTCGPMQEYIANFGQIQPRKYDMGTHVAAAVLQGAQNFRCVRVTDGTDVAATAPIQETTPGQANTACLTLTALYTGTLGNSISWQIVTGSKANSYALVVGIPGQPTERFDNLTGSGGAFWTAAANAVNNGNSPLRGPSKIIRASTGSGTTSPTLASGTLTGGTDGVGTINGSVLIGTDGTTRTGMYALRGQKCAIALLADCDDSTTWSTQVSFGLSEGIYMIATGPSGDTISNAVSVKGMAGIDSYAMKLMFGDWLYFNDVANGQIRLISPQGFVAGRLANLSPEQSSLNKQLYGVVGSQKSGVVSTAASGSYSDADLAVLFQAGIDVVCNPQPGGAYWGVRGGLNSSSNAAVNGDNYTRLTNYIASTLAAGMGVYVGRTVSDRLLRSIRSTLLSFLQNLLSQSILGSVDGSTPYAVVCDTTNNPQSQLALGYVQADIAVNYQAINDKFILNLQGGQTVTVTQQSNGLTISN